MEQPLDSQRDNSSFPVDAETLGRLISDVWDPLEIKIVLAIAAQGGSIHPVAQHTIVSDSATQKGVMANGSARDPRVQIAEALQAAVARGLLLALTADEKARWFVLATPENELRARSGEFVIPETTPPVSLPLERPAVFGVYEQNIGLITPIIADRIADALHRFPEHWIEDAIGESVTYNRRNWRYIERILENWASEGRSNETAQRNHEKHQPAGKSLRDKYAPYLRKR